MAGKHGNVMSKSISHLSLDNASGRMYRGPAYIHIYTCKNLHEHPKGGQSVTIMWEDFKLEFHFDCVF